MSFESKYDSYRWFKLNWPLDLETKEVSSWLQAINGQNAGRGLKLYIVATKGKIDHYLAIKESKSRIILQFIKTCLPGIEIIEDQEPQIILKLSTKVCLTNKTRVLQTRFPEIISCAILTSISILKSGEQVVLNLVLGAGYSSSDVNKYPKQSLFNLGLGNEKQPLNSEVLASQRLKQSSSNWNTNFYIGIWADEKKRQNILLSRIAGSLKTAEAPGVRLITRPTSRKALDYAHEPHFWSLKLNIEELTGLLAWPLGNMSYAGIPRITSRFLPMPKSMPKVGKVIAKTRGTKSKLRLTTEDALLHAHILGPTGVGKSTLLLNLIHQDIQENSPVIVVDPKGDLVRDVLERIPLSRANDVIVLDPSDLIYPVGLNPLILNEQSPAVAVDNILSIFRGLYRSNFGPRTEDVLHAGLLTLARAPGMTLSVLPLLYTNQAFRERLTHSIDDPLGLSPFWLWFNSISEAEKAVVIAPVMNKVRTFLLRQSMRGVIGQSDPKLKISEVLNTNKILLVSLAKGQLGCETAQLFGSLVVSQIWHAIQSRANLPSEHRTPAFVYIDEIQDYLHLPTDIGDVLAQSRGYGVGLTLAHQHLSQLPTDLRDGILANARNQICFQLGHNDSAVMAKSSNILTPRDFENLSRYHLYARLVTHGSVQPWVSGITFAPPKRLNNAEYIQSLSRQEYGVPVEQVNKNIFEIVGSSPHHIGVLNISNLVKMRQA